MRDTHASRVAQYSGQLSHDNTGVNSHANQSVSSSTTGGRWGQRKRFFGQLPQRARNLQSEQPTLNQPQSAPPKPPYEDTVFGSPQSNSPAPKKSPKANLRLSVNLGLPDMKSTRSFFREHRSEIIKLASAATVFILVAGGAVMFLSARNSDIPQVAGANYIPPKTIFMPRPMPEDFSVGSSAQELENGAVLYTVFGPNGSVISITQHAKAAEFDEETLKGGLKFVTDHGNGYVIETNERITGFLLAEDSWVLLNSTDSVTADEMRTLIRTLQPSKR